jgi:hypothetical protein
MFSTAVSRTQLAQETADDQGAADHEVMNPEWSFLGPMSSVHPAAISVLVCA